MSKWCNGNSLGCDLEIRSSNPRSADHFSETNIILGPSNDKLDHEQAWVFSLCFEKLANLGHYLEFFFSRISSLIRVFFHFFHSSFSKSRPFFLFFSSFILSRFQSIYVAKCDIYSILCKKTSVKITSDEKCITSHLGTSWSSIIKYDLIIICYAWDFSFIARVNKFEKSSNSFSHLIENFRPTFLWVTF